MRRESLLIVVAVAVVAWGSLLWFKFSGDASKDAQEAVVVVAPPSDPSETAGATGALSPGGAAALPTESEPVDDGSGEVLVTTRPSSIYASPSASAPVLYAFPAGRQLRVIAREGGFVRIKELQSGATGWAEASTLAPGSASAANTPTAPTTPSAAAEPSVDSGEAASTSDPATESQPAVAPPPQPKSSATQRAATRAPANSKTAGKPPAAGSATSATPAQKQAAAKREAQPAERSGPFPDFLKRAFGGR
jgi:hypothetical protein